MSAADQALTQLAVQYWKLCAAFEREVALGAEGRREAGEAQLRFARRKLDTILEQEGMHLQTFDGAPWSPEIPASAINPEDVADGAGATIANTIEPTVIGAEGILHNGKILLKQA
jgi:hypothetical protein